MASIGSDWMPYRSYHIAADILSKPGRVYLTISDADNFFIDLANELQIPAPLLIRKPFTHLNSMLNTVAPVTKNDRVTTLTSKALRDTNLSVKYFETNELSDQVELTQLTREVLVFDQFERISETFSDVL